MTDDRAWMEFALCKGAPLEIFFPDANPTGTHLAQAICKECPVKAPCLDYALKNYIEQGVWGGTSERTRRKLRRARRLRQTG